MKNVLDAPLHPLHTTLSLFLSSLYYIVCTCGKKRRREEHFRLLLGLTASSIDEILDRPEGDALNRTRASRRGRHTLLSLSLLYSFRASSSSIRRRVMTQLVTCRSGNFSPKTHGVWRHPIVCIWWYLRIKNKNNALTSTTTTILYFCRVVTNAKRRTSTSTSTTV